MQDVADALGAFGYKSDFTPAPQFELWEMNLEAYEVFCACRDDWHKNRQGQYLSIMKPALNSIMDMMTVTNKKQIFYDILAMQDAALEVLSHG
jgi:hypothetical protein